MKPVLWDASNKALEEATRLFCEASGYNCKRSIDDALIIWDVSTLEPMFIIEKGQLVWMQGDSIFVGQPSYMSVEELLGGYGFEVNSLPLATVPGGLLTPVQAIDAFADASIAFTSLLAADVPVQELRQAIAKEASNLIEVLSLIQRSCQSWEKDD